MPVVLVLPPDGRHLYRFIHLTACVLIIHDDKTTYKSIIAAAVQTRRASALCSERVVQLVISYSCQNV